jgi:hypothetical protein
LKPENPSEHVENIEERAQRLVLLGVAKIGANQELMFESDPPTFADPLSSYN